MHASLNVSVKIKLRWVDNITLSILRNGWKTLEESCISVDIMLLRDPISVTVVKLEFTFIAD